MKFYKLKHAVYGHCRSEVEWHDNDSPMATIIVDTPRDTVAETAVYQVGKVALSNTGGYKPVERTDRCRVELHLPLVTRCVSLLKRPEDDWDELYAIGSLGLVEASDKYDDRMPYPFTAFAKPYIMGHIKNAINPERNGTMNQVPLIEGMDIPVSKQRNDVWDGFWRGFEHMTKKQQQLTKLHYVEGHSLSESAKIMGMTKYAAQRMEKKALTHVRKLFEETMA